MCDIPLTHRLGQASVIYQKDMRVCVTLTIPEHIFDLLYALCYILMLFFSTLESILSSSQKMVGGGIYIITGGNTAWGALYL